jgi:hypothetical protein
MADAQVLPLTPNAPALTLLQRIKSKLRHRWQWRVSRSRQPRLSVVSQFFSPDFAATGQLLEDLTNRLSASGLQVQILSGMPAYAYTSSHAKRIEFKPNRCPPHQRLPLLASAHPWTRCEWCSLLPAHLPAFAALFPPW